MTYTDHNGKVRKVSETRYGMFLADERNDPMWLNFRIKHFGFSKEELVMNPSSSMLFHNDINTDGRIREVYYSTKRKQFSGGFYMGGHNWFNTPEEAYEYAKSIN